MFSLAASKCMKLPPTRFQEEHDVTFMFPFTLLGNIHVYKRHNVNLHTDRDVGFMGERGKIKPLETTECF